MGRLYRLVLIAALALAGATTQAAPNSASATPGSLTASLSATLPTTLLWTVHLIAIGPNGAPGPTLLTSTAAVITTPGGQVLQTIPVPLTVHLPKIGTGTVVETIVISPATVAAALRLGGGPLLLQRTFGMPPFAVTGTVTISIAGSAGGPLAIARVALHFEDRQLRRILSPGESATAVAEINFTGNGVLNGLWEVASPPSTLGEPVFVPLAAASLNVAGGGLAEVTSPPLPSAFAGSYLVRFRLRSPVVPFTGLVIQYAVTESDASVQPIEIVSPEQHGTLGAGTHFQWQPAAGAIAYRLEFFTADQAEPAQPVSGQWLPAAQRDALLSALARTHLQPGQLYRWRIVALADDSRVVGRSAFYEISTP